MNQGAIIIRPFGTVCNWAASFFPPLKWLQTDRPSGAKPWNPGTLELWNLEPWNLEPGTLELWNLEPGTLEPGTLEPGTLEL